MRFTNPRCRSAHRRCRTRVGLISKAWPMLKTSSGPQAASRCSNLEPVDVHNILDMAGAALRCASS